MIHFDSLFDHIEYEAYSDIDLIDDKSIYFSKENIVKAHKSRKAHKKTTKPKSDAYLYKLDLYIKKNNIKSIQTQYELYNFIIKICKSASIKIPIEFNLIDFTKDIIDQKQKGLIKVNTLFNIMNNNSQIKYTNGSWLQQFPMCIKYLMKKIKFVNDLKYHCIGIAAAIA